MLSCDNARTTAQLRQCLEQPSKTGVSLSSFLFLSENKLVNTLEIHWVSLYKQLSSTGLKKSLKFLPCFLPPAILLQVMEEPQVTDSRSNV